MARRRKVSNLLALAVLTTVGLRPMHPYEIATTIRRQGKDRDMGVKWGSLYTVVQNLEKHGFIEATQTQRQGGRPERTVYQITEAGREEARDWVRELLAEPEPETSRFVAGLSVLAILPPDEVTDLLRRRCEVLEQQLAVDRADLSRHATRIPRLFLIEAEYDLAVRDAEVAWIRGVLAELTGGTFPGLDQWRHFHITGELPPDLVAMATGMPAAPDEEGG
jgi:DNA-binding PadR family transcriptional regulator